MNAIRITFIAAVLGAGLVAMPASADRDSRDRGSRDRIVIIKHGDHLRDHRSDRHKHRRHVERHRKIVPHRYDTSGIQLGFTIGSPSWADHVWIDNRYRGHDRDRWDHRRDKSRHHGRQGYRSGYQSGYQAGYREGYRDAIRKSKRHRW